jgi:hypothetical protein
VFHLIIPEVVGNHPNARRKARRRRDFGVSLGGAATLRRAQAGQSIDIDGAWSVAGGKGLFTVHRRDDAGTPLDNSDDVWTQQLQVGPPRSRR